MNEALFGFLEACSQGLFRVGGKGWLFDDELVQVVSEEIRTAAASVAVEDAEKGALGPVLVLSASRLQDILDDGDTILVVVSNDALVGVGSISKHAPVSLERALGGLVVRYDDLLCGLQWNPLEIFSDGTRLVLHPILHWVVFGTGGLLARKVARVDLVELAGVDEGHLGGLPEGPTLEKASTGLRLLTFVAEGSNALRLRRFLLLLGNLDFKVLLEGELG